MGWKNIKTRFNIEHIVQIRDNRICIGSPYIGEIISISFDGKLLKQYKDHSNDDLARYNSELIEAEKTGELKKLIDLQDTFKDLKIIYTFEKGRVITKYCEEYNWPNVCTDGYLIYENTFFKDRKEAVKECRLDARIGLKYSAIYFKEKFTELNKNMFKATKRLILDVYELIISFFN
jgi:hypothetical protein